LCASAANSEKEITMLYLGPDDITLLHAEGIVRMLDYVTAIEAGYRDKGQGGVQVLPRINLWADEKLQGARPRSLKVAGALLRGVGVMGTVAYSAGYGGGQIDLWIELFSATSGEMLAILHSQDLSLWKTGATAAVAAKHMSRPDSAIVAMIGTGRFARTQLTGLMAVRRISELRCYSRGKDGLNTFAEWARQVLGNVRVRCAANPRDAVEGADIIVTVTTSKEPVLEGDWIASGAHCNAIGMHYPEMREVDTRAVQRSQVIVDDLDQALQEKGELLIPMRDGEIDRAHILGDLGDLMAGRVALRTRPDAITMFCSGGVALEYMASCLMIYRKAEAAGIGQALGSNSVKRERR
jgi:alanine dehydrogenase